MTSMVLALPSLDIEARYRWSQRLLLFGVGVMCLLGLRSPTAFALYLLLLVLAVALAPQRTFKPMFREPLFWLALALFVAVFLRGWLDVAAAEARGDPIRADAIWHHARYGLFIPLLLGLGIAVHWRYRYTFMLLIGLGFLIWVHYEWAAISGRWPWPDGAAINHSFSEGGLIALLMLFLGLASVAAAFTDPVRQRRGWFYPHLFLSVAVSIAGLLVVLVSHSRNVYVTTLFALLVVAVAAGCYVWRGGTRHERRLVGGALGSSVVVVALVALLAGGFLVDKLSKYEGVAMNLLSGEVFRTGIPDERGWARAHLVQQGLADTAERLWIGHGPSSVRFMADQRAGVTGADHAGNYHNTYVNLAVAMGAPWLLLWVAGHLWAIGRALRHVLVTERDLVLALAIFSMAVAHFFSATFQLRIWSGHSAAALYLLLMMLVFAAVWRSVLVATRNGESASETTQ